MHTSLKIHNYVIIAIVTLILGQTTFANTMTLKEENLTDFTKPIVVKAVKPEFEIRLKSNPTTGYLWFYNSDENSPLIEPLSNQFVAEKTGRVGSGGVDVWTFKVKKQAFKITSRLIIKFSYLRSWEIEPVQNVEFTILTVK